MTPRPNDRGGWDLTDNDVAAVLSASEPECSLEGCSDTRPHYHQGDDELVRNLPAYPAPGSVVAATVQPARTVPVSEVFPAWQGEGPASGRSCTFLRLGLCNLHCSWCDTPFTWDHSRYDVAAECPPQTSDWIVKRVMAHPARLLVLSGGEPLMHRANPALIGALGELKTMGMEIHVETNGTLAPTPQLDELIDQYVVSPKIAQDDDPLSKRIKPAVLRTFGAYALLHRAVFKFVARHEDDVHAIRAVVRDHHLPHGSVWVMPEGTNGPDMVHTHRLIAPALERTGFNTSTRLHVLLYGDQRGK